LVRADADLAQTASLIGNETRARLLLSLLDGQPRSASELARAGGVSAATASQHLSRLLDGKLVEVSATGRYRFYCLAGRDVASALETLAVISPSRRARSLHQANAGERLRAARSCYDHVAGRVGVLIADRLTEEGVIAPLQERGIGELLQPRHRLLEALRVPTPLVAAAGRRPMVRGCLDWTERRPHVAGHLGATILASLLDNDWLTRRVRDRSLQLTPEGRIRLGAALQVDTDALTATGP
jgi:DNA-binding transcriptional ArsR family regulator